MYYTEWNDAKTRQGMLPKVSFTCGIGTVEMYESGCTRVYDVDLLMEIQIDSMFRERAGVFVDYLGRILDLSNEESEILLKEILVKDFFS